MKVFEVLNPQVKSVSIPEIERRLANFNWLYEFSDDFKEIATGTRELELLENMIYQLWKEQPELAIKLWRDNCPQNPADPETPPAFLYRLQAQEE